MRPAQVRLSTLPGLSQIIDRVASLIDVRGDEALHEAKRSGRNRVLRYEVLVAEGTIAKRPKPVASIEMF